MSCMLNEYRMQNDLSNKSDLLKRTLHCLHLKHSMPNSLYHRTYLHNLRRNLGIMCCLHKQL
jgi:hypothetical protein